MVAGELGRFKKNSLAFDAQLLPLPAAMSRTGVATSENPTDKSDHTHFDAASADELNRRYADRMLALQSVAAATKGTKNNKVNAKAVVK